MILTFLNKHWRLMLDALIVVLVVIFLFWINPFGIFGKGLKLQATSNNVASIKTIGQLVTAEYYGEVISTLNESRLQLIHEDQLNLEANKAFKTIKAEILSIYENQNVPDDKKWYIPKAFYNLQAKKDNEADIEEFFFTGSQNIEADTLKSAIIEFYYRTCTSNFEKLDKAFDTKQLKKSLFSLKDEIIEKRETLSQAQFEAFLAEGLPVKHLSFSQFFYDKQRSNYTRNEKKKKLAMIGRGWVKAGFNFGEFDDSNFNFDEEEGIVYLYGIEPEILDADINPWFIPENKVPGFQILEANDRVNFEDAVLVKSYCIDKLRKKAIDAGIIDQAAANGQEALKAFVSLVTGTDVLKVVLTSDPVSIIAKETFIDEFISFHEAILFDSVINEELLVVDSLQHTQTNVNNNRKEADAKLKRLQATIAKAKTMEFAGFQPRYNKYAALVYSVCSDSIFTNVELQHLQQSKTDLKEWITMESDEKDRFMVWYSDSLEFITAYNRAVNYVVQNTNKFGSLRDTIIANETELAKLKVKLRQKNYKIVTAKDYGTQKYVNYIQPDTSIATQLNNLQYPLQVANNWLELTLSTEHFSLKPDTTANLTEVKVNQQKLYADSLVLLQFNSWEARVDSIEISWKPNEANYFAYMYKLKTADNEIGFFTRSRNKMLNNKNTPEKPNFIKKFRTKVSRMVGK